MLSLNGEGTQEIPHIDGKTFPLIDSLLGPPTFNKLYAAQYYSNITSLAYTLT